MSSPLSSPASSAMVVAICTLCGAGAVAAAEPDLPSDDQRGPAESTPTSVEIDPVFQLGVQGYGEFGGAWLDHGPNRNRPRGAQRDSRAVCDAGDAGNATSPSREAAAQEILIGVAAILDDAARVKIAAAQVAIRDVANLLAEEAVPLIQP